MYQSDAIRTQLLKTSIKLNEQQGEEMKRLKRIRSVQEGLPVMESEIEDPIKKRLDVINQLKRITIVPLKAYSYLFDGGMIKTFHERVEQFIKSINKRSNLDFETFKSLWEKFYDGLIASDSLPKEDVIIDTAEEYNAALTLIDDIQKEEPTPLKQTEGAVSSKHKRIPLRPVGRETSENDFRRREIDDNIKQLDSKMKTYKGVGRKTKEFLELKQERNNQLEEYLNVPP